MSDLTPRELAAYAVLAAFLAVSTWLFFSGEHVIWAWMVGAAGFSVAAAIAGKDAGKKD